MKVEVYSESLFLRAHVLDAAEPDKFRRLAILLTGFKVTTMPALVYAFTLVFLRAPNLAKV